MEINWDIRTTTFKDYLDNQQNTFILKMWAKHFIQVKGKRQLFTYTESSKEPRSVEDRLKIFSEDATKFFERIESALRVCDER